MLNRFHKVNLDRKTPPEQVALAVSCAAWFRPIPGHACGGFLTPCPVPLVRLQFERMGGTVTPAAKLSFLSHKLSLDNPQFSGFFRIQ